MHANERELLLKDQVYAVVGAAMEVSNELGTGFLEAIYQEALEIELGSRSIPFISQVPVDIVYKGRRLSKQYLPDLVCFDQVIVEIKAIKRLTSIEEAQLLNYLKATGMQVGILLNFGSSRLDWKRMVISTPNTRAHFRSLAAGEDGGFANEHD